MTAREAILLTVCSKTPWKQPRARAVTQPKGTGISQEAGKTWPSLPAKRCQQRCVPLDATSEGPGTETAVPRLGQELPSCVPSHGDPNLGPGEGLSQPESAGFHTREDTLHHAVKLMERRELKPWMHCIDCGFLSQRLFRISFFYSDPF